MNRSAIAVPIGRILLSTIVIGGMAGLIAVFILPRNPALPLPVSQGESFVKGWIIGGFCGTFIGIAFESFRRRVASDAAGGGIGSVTMMSDYLATTLLFNIWVHSRFAALNWEESIFSFLAVHALTFGLLGAIVGAMAHLIGAQFRPSPPSPDTG